MYIVTEGIVLRSVVYKDSDAILTLFTRKMGKVSAYARNVRKLNHMSMACSQVFAYGTFQLRDKGKMMNVVSFDLKDNYYAITSSLDKTYLAYYLVDLTEQVSVESQTNHRLLTSLIECLDFLKMSEKLVLTKLFYQIKVLTYSGLKPEVLKCMNCGINNDGGLRFYFHMQDGGLYCRRCCNDLQEDVMLESYDNTTYRLLNYLSQNAMSEVSQARISTILLSELAELIEKYYIVHLPDISVKSEEFIRHIKP